MYENVSVPAGSTLWIALDQPLSSTYSGVGDTVRAHTVRDLVASNGEVLVPTGATVVARVIDRQGAGPGSPIWLRVETIQMGGIEQPASGDVMGAVVPDGYGNSMALYNDRSLRGELPAGTQLQIRLSRPLNSLASLRAGYY